MIENLSIAVHAFARCILTSFSVDETLLPRYVDLSTNFRAPPFRPGMSPWLKQKYSVLSAFTWRPMPSAPCPRLCSRDSAWICEKRYVICVVCLFYNFCGISSVPCLFYHMPVIFVPSFLCVWNQMPWRNLQTRVSPRCFFYCHFF